MEAMVGLPGILPRYPERPRIVHTGAMTLNNIQVSNSQIGVLNTGTLENVDATVNVLRSEGNPELAAAVLALAQALVATTELSNVKKNQALELLGTLGEEAAAPREKRKPSVIRALMTELSGILGGIAALSGFWEATKVLVEKLLGQ